MDLFKILTYPNPVLRRHCEEIKNIDEELHLIVRRMAATMYKAKGIGLAAPQVGILRQIITLDIGEGLLTLINPRITLHEGEAKMEEGCLCLPKITVEVPRYEKVQVRGVDLDGNQVTIDAEGLLARALQHEIDHLHGRLIIDKVSRLKRDLIIKQYKKLNANGDNT
ncbi:MAG: peptide deformylase [Desulfobacterota bacterium]|nr:peptide deformylase [Thermodesulfobacteriota bacterium]